MNNDEKMQFSNDIGICYTFQFLLSTEIEIIRELRKYPVVSLITAEEAFNKFPYFSINRQFAIYTDRILGFSLLPDPGKYARKCPQLYKISSNVPHYS